VESFGKAMTPPIFKRVFILSLAQNVAVAFSPGCVVNFYDDGFDACVSRVVAVIKTGGIKTKAEVSQVSQQADGASRPAAEPLFNEVPDAPVEG
jgi:hypothetical protein